MYINTPRREQLGRFSQMVILKAFKTPFFLFCLVIVIDNDYLGYLSGTLWSLPSHSSSFKDRVPADIICGYTIYKWVGMTWFN